MDLNPTHLTSVKFLIDIKHTRKNKASAFKIHIISERLSQVSGADDDQMMFLVKAQYAADLRIPVSYTHLDVYKRQFFLYVGNRSLLCLTMGRFALADICRLFFFV